MCIYVCDLMATYVPPIEGVRIVHSTDVVHDIHDTCYVVHEHGTDAFIFKVHIGEI